MLLGTFEESVLDEGLKIFDLGAGSGLAGRVGW